MLKYISITSCEEHSGFGTSVSRRSSKLNGSFLHAAKHNSQHLESQSGIWLERMAIEGCILLSASCVCGCGFNLQQHIMFSRYWEKRVSKLSSAQSISDGTEVFTRSLVVSVLDESQSLCKTER